MLVCLVEADQFGTEGPAKGSTGEAVASYMAGDVRHFVVRFDSRDGLYSAPADWFATPSVFPDNTVDDTEIKRWADRLAVEILSND